MATFCWKHIFGKDPVVDSEKIVLEFKTFDELPNQFVTLELILLHH